MDATNEAFTVFDSSDIVSYLWFEVLEDSETQTIDIGLAKQVYASSQYAVELGFESVNGTALAGGVIDTSIEITQEIY